MIRRIDKDSLASLANARLAHDAARYVEMYETFLRDVVASGIPLAPPRADGRDEQLVGLRHEGAEILGAGDRVHFGPLSPACEACRTGVGSHTFILTLACNRDCYFCTNRNQADYEAGRRGVYDVIAQFDVLVAREPLRAVALTGGEPLLRPDDSERFVRHVKARSPSTHIRIYSNGDLATPELLASLGASGLDELRLGLKLTDDFAFNPADLETVGAAVACIPSVVVEMPVPPGAGGSLRRLLAGLVKHRATGVNLLEYLYPWRRGKEYRRRGFAVAARPYRVLYDYNYAGGLPVDGSAEECLALVRWAAEERLRLGVLYCSLENKLTAQRYCQNARAKLSPVEVFSPTDFFIKTARLYGSAARRAAGLLSSIAPGAFLENRQAEQVELHPSLLPRLAEDGALRDEEVGLTYNMVERSGDAKLLREVHIDVTTPRVFEPSADI